MVEDLALGQRLQRLSLHEEVEPPQGLGAVTIADSGESDEVAPFERPHGHHPQRGPVRVRLVGVLGADT